MMYVHKDLTVYMYIDMQNESKLYTQHTYAVGTLDVLSVRWHGVIVKET